MSPSVTMFVRNNLVNDSRVWKEATVLHGAGWDVRLVGVQSAGLPAQSVQAGIELVRVKVEPWDSRILKRRMPALGAPSFTTSPTRTARAPGARLRAWVKNHAAAVHEEIAERAYTAAALKAIAAKPTNVYHAHDINAAAPALEARKRYGGQVVVDHHEFFSERNFYRHPGRLEHRRLRRWERIVCRAADLNLTVSEGIAAELYKRYGLRKLPDVVLNSPRMRELPADITPLAKRLGIQGKVILYIGLVTFNRGLEQVIAALASEPAWNLVVLGPVQRGYRDALESLAGRPGRLYFMDPVAADDVPAVAAGADVAVAMIQNVCLSYYYCSPNKLFEALAAGLPVVASDFPEMRRVVGNSDVAVLCRPDDPLEIHAALRVALGRNRSVIAPLARDLAASYSWDVEGRKFVSLYNRLYNECVTV